MTLYKASKGGVCDRAISDLIQTALEVSVRREPTYFGQAYTHLEWLVCSLPLIEALWMPRTVFIELIPGRALRYLGR
jgi:hypothetical protein